MVLDVERDDPLRAVVEGEHESRSERPEAVQVCRIETTGRMREADGTHDAGRIRPPLLDGAAGEPEIAGEVAEKVEGQRRRREEIGPQSLVVEALVRLDGRCPGLRRVERARTDEVRPGRLPVRERHPAPDESCLATVGPGSDRLRTDGMPVGLTPLRLVVAHPSAERGHLRTPWYVVVAFPAVSAL